MEDGFVSRPSNWLSNGFSRYAQRRICKEFHRMRLLGEEPSFEAEPLVVYANHSGWWDPMVALAIRPLYFGERQAYVPIAAEMLERYGIFKRLGFFPVQRDSARGVVRYLDEAEHVLKRPGSMLYLTPQGRFADVRERPLQFQRGIGHLAQRVGGVQFLPLAIEYVYWEESKPEVLIHFGAPRRFPETEDREEVRATLESDLQGCLDRLAQASLERDTERFHSVLEGRAGVGGVYDFWRSLKSRLAGKRPSLRHSDL